MNLKQFTEWAMSQVSLANPAPNYKYKGQCVSFIQQMLYQVLGIPFQGRGNAKDWENNADVLTHFNKLPSNTPLQPGDILVYGSNYGGGYGHMGLIGADGKYYDQNGIKSLAMGVANKPFNGYVCVLRSKKQIDIGNDVPDTNQYKITVNIGVNFRRSYSILSGKIGAIPKNTVLTVTDTYKGITWFWGKTTYNGQTGWFAIKKNNNSEIYAIKV